jgi:hypothetical protein
MFQQRWPLRFFWYMTSYSLVHRLRCFGGSCFLCVRVGDLKVSSKTKWCCVASQSNVILFHHSFPQLWGNLISVLKQDTITVMLHDYLAWALTQLVTRFPRESAKHWTNFTGAPTLSASGTRPSQQNHDGNTDSDGTRTALPNVELTRFAWWAIAQSV